MRLGAAHNLLACSPRLSVDNPRFSCVSAFLDFLGERSADEWLTIGASPSADAGIVAILEAAVADQRLHVDAWHVRDAVETLVFLATCPLGAPPRRAQRAMTRARVAAEHAALAIIVRRSLRCADVAELLAPFSGLDDRLASPKLRDNLIDRRSR
jgi:hypothetical protein